MQKEHMQLATLRRPGILSPGAQEHGPNDARLGQNQRGWPLNGARVWANWEIIPLSLKSALPSF